MRFDTKIALVVRADLREWQKLNVTAYLASGLAHADPGIMGEPYLDGSDNGYLPMFREPTLVFAADADGLARTHGRALSRGLARTLYTEELFGTDHDAANRAAVRAVPAEELRLVGLGIYGPRNAVDRTVKGLALHG